MVEKDRGKVEYHRRADLPVQSSIGEVEGEGSIAMMGRWLKVNSDCKSDR
jgi:hypothetical protein